MTKYSQVYNKTKANSSSSLVDFDKEAAADDVADFHSSFFFRARGSFFLQCTCKEEFVHQVSKVAESVSQAAAAAGGKWGVSAPPS